MASDLFTQILTLIKRIHGKQKLLGEFILSHFEEIPFLTSSQIAHKAGVSEATVIRFAKLLGYRGLPDLKDEFQKLVLRSLAPHERLQKTSRDGSNTIDELIDSTFDRETRNLRETQKRLKTTLLVDIAKVIVQARRRYVVGLRASSACAFLLGHFLSHILPRVMTITDGDSRLFEGLKSIDKKDVLIVVSYPRYSKPTIQALEFSKARQVKTIALTDAPSSPAAQIADAYIVAPAVFSSFANSYTACVVVINLLITLVAHLNKDESERMLREWENALNHLDFFYKARRP